MKFDECHFEIVPDVLYSLPQLTELDISSQKTNSKLSIDKSFPKLKKLNLERNFQPNIHCIQPQLVNLNISSCKLNSFPETISKMEDISILGMMDNLFTSFHFEIEKLVKLKDFSFDLSLLDEKSIQILNGLSKLTTLRLNIDNTTSEDIEQLLQIGNWTNLYTNDVIEDMFVGKKILERKNLRLIEMKGEKMNLKEARALLGILV
ncbi:hypothetical protein [Dysgonomonas sp. ZJ279]|uniref:hypothetical protein n=1 Tax=Dysgonomonas sp. ZJ279 TaxID=2709796 RepID=UPI0013EC37EA|nr:hypothetical protein [Dysgonomonas sp. ZJ279]